MGPKPGRCVRIAKIIWSVNKLSSPIPGRRTKTSMSKKHYIKIAEALRGLLDAYKDKPDAREALGAFALLYARIARDDNSSFDESRFTASCGLKG